MNSYLLNRSVGSISPQALARAQTTRLVHALQPAPTVRFSSSHGGTSTAKVDGEELGDGDTVELWAHKAGVNALIVDNFEGRYMLSGGSDSSIHLWDLESEENNDRNYTYHPSGTVPITPSSHKFGITHLSFYPFDSLAFLSSSYDHTLKIYSSTTLQASASFSLSSVIYTHALSPIASHLLVACATQHPAVRLVDLRTGASTHSLAGHEGAVLALSWSPREEHILASGGIDGAVRLWDIRRSAASLGVLDMEDSTGIVLPPNSSSGATRPLSRGKAHTGAVNGLLWTPSGSHILSAGHDERIRIWDASTAANTLTSFGPVIRNDKLATVHPVIVSSDYVAPGRDVLFFPNEKDILVFDLFDGRLLKRLRPPGSFAVAQARGSAGQRNLKNRVTGLAWRAGGCVEMLSGHSDGVVRAWMPRTKEDAEVEEEEEEEMKEKRSEGHAEDESRKRKRKVLEDVYQDLTKQKITFS
ncbi:MAG: hypothetical protein M1827_000656 [Pycnora praestabilis]|nr:MAG: hypothetical protein M1827_000656 [Pycnora praestabilis]